MIDTGVTSEPVPADKGRNRDLPPLGRVGVADSRHTGRCDSARREACAKSRDGEEFNVGAIAAISKAQARMLTLTLRTKYFP
jgi:hypothetical protein